MKGIAQYVSSNRQRVAALTDEGYTVFDIEDGEVNPHDVLSGCLDDHGSTVLSNQTTGQKVHVYIEAIQASQASADHLVGHTRHR